MYELLLYKKAAKYYENLDAKTAGRINRAIEKIIEKSGAGSAHQEP